MSTPFELSSSLLFEPTFHFSRRFEYLLGMPGHYTLDRGLYEVNATTFRWKIPGTYTDRDGTVKERGVRDICPVDTYDPAPIRGLKPPPRDSTTRIPLAIMLPSGHYSWCDMTFNDLLKVWGLVHPDDFNLFAIMLGNHAQHFVIDVDGAADVWPGLLEKEVEIEAELRVLFCEFYETQFGAVPDMAAWRADRVPAPAKGAPTKMSIHVNHPGVAFKEQRDLREFVLRWVRWIVKTHPKSALVRAGAVPSDLVRADDFMKVSPIDTSVYNKDRNMRLSHSRKPRKQPLMPMDPNTTPEDALWSSLCCYSMPSDPAEWLSYKDGEHHEVEALEPANKKRKAPAPLPDRMRAPPIIVRSAEAGDDSTGFKGTVCQLPPKEGATAQELGTCDAGAVDLPAKDTEGGMSDLPAKEETADTQGDAEKEVVFTTGVPAQEPFFKYLPAPKPADIKLLVTKLSRETRLVGCHNNWRDVVWAVKNACPDAEGYTILEEWTATGKPNSTRPSKLKKTWDSGKKHGFNVGSLWGWLKEDLADRPEEYKALWRQVNPPAAMLHAKQLAGVAEPAAGGPLVDALTAQFRAAFTDEEKRNAEDQLDFKAVMAWWSKHVYPKIEDEQLKDSDISAIGRCVLEFCNLYWCFVKLESTAVFYKKARRVAGDDRTYTWQVTSSVAFQRDLNSNFVLAGWTMGKVTANVASHWMKWTDRRVYNSHVHVPPSARPEVQPIPTCLNTWVGVKVSHITALASAPAGSPNPEWDLFKRYICEGFLELEKSPAVKLYFLKWFCSQYVRPGWKTKVACAMQSKRRQVGKSFLAQGVQHSLLGDDICAETQPEFCLGKFNDPLIGRIFVNLEEFERCRDYNNKLKVLITSNTMTVHSKGEKADPHASNCINFWCPTNDEDAFDMKDFAGRIFAVQVGDGVHTEGFKHLIGRAWDWVAIARGMLEWWNKPENGCVDDTGRVVWRPEEIPETVGALRQKLAAESKVDPVAAWVRALVTGEATETVPWDTWVSNEKVSVAFVKHYAGDRDLVRVWTQNKLTAQLKTMFPGWSRKQRKVNGATAQCVQLPALEVARAEFYKLQHEEEPQFLKSEDVEQVDAAGGVDVELEDGCELVSLSTSR